MNKSDREKIKGEWGGNLGFTGKSDYKVLFFTKHIMFYYGLWGHFALGTLLETWRKESVLPKYRQTYPN